MPPADTNPRASLEFVLGQMDAKLGGICREIGEIKDAMRCKSKDCEDCRNDIEGKITKTEEALKVLQDTHTGEKAVKSWKDLTLGQIVMMIGAAGGLVALGVTVWDIITGKGI